MKSSAASAKSEPHVSSETPPGAGDVVTRVVLLGAAAAALVVALVFLAGSLPAWGLVAGGAVLGVIICAVWFQLRFSLPLSRLQQVTRSLEGGDLSPTLPETGPPVLHMIARSVNSMLADFQEVLLLFAHLLRSTRRAAKRLQTIRNGSSEDGGDREPADRAVDEIIESIAQMEEMIHDFRFFRVRIEDSMIIDLGIPARADRGDGPGSEAGDRP